MLKILRTFVGMIALVLIGFGVAATPSYAAGPPTGGISFASTRYYQPCATEDGPGPCIWDAKTRGNGQGISYRLTDAAGTQANLNDTYCTQAQLQAGTGPCRLVTDQSQGYNAVWLLKNGNSVGVR